MKYNTCLNCEERCLGCHSNCEMYNKYKQELKRIQENKKKQSVWASYKRERVRRYCV